MSCPRTERSDAGEASLRCVLGQDNMTQLTAVFISKEVPKQILKFVLAFFFV